MSDESTLYVKHGRRYRPIGRFWPSGALGYGSWFVRVSDGCTSYALCESPEPNNAELAIREATNTIIEEFDALAQDRWSKMDLIDAVIRGVVRRAKEREQQS